MDAEIALREISVPTAAGPRVARLPRVVDRLAKVARRVGRAARDVWKQPVLPLEALLEASVLAEEVRRRTDSAKDPWAQPLFKTPINFEGLARDLEPGQAAGLRARRGQRDTGLEDATRRVIDRIWP
jgi:hypothetical protein